MGMGREEKTDKLIGAVAETVDKYIRITGIREIKEDEHGEGAYTLHKSKSTRTKQLEYVFCTPRGQLSLVEAAKSYGINVNTLRRRIWEKKMSVKDMLTRPCKKGNLTS